MKKKKINKLAALQTAFSDLALLVSTERLSRIDDANKARYDVAVQRDVISGLTTRLTVLNTQVDRNVLDVNAGFQEIKKDLIRAGSGLTSHERDIAQTITRVTTLERNEESQRLVRQAALPKPRRKRGRK